jgi:hypothetical protein
VLAHSTNQTRDSLPHISNWRRIVTRNPRGKQKKRVLEIALSVSQQPKHPKGWTPNLRRIPELRPVAEIVFSSVGMVENFIRCPVA